MEKVKVTQKQAAAIEVHKKHIGTDLPEIINTQISGWQFQENKCLDELTLDEFIRALYIGYEVELGFNIGDWVVLEDGFIGEIEFINELEGWANIGDTKRTKERGVCLAKTYDLIDIVRHATPSEIAEEKERRWWKKHGRDVWELKKGDLLFCNHGGRVHRVMQPNLNKPAQDETRLSDGLWVTDDELKRNWKVACFIKDRLDVKTND